MTSSLQELTKHSRGRMKYEIETKLVGMRTICFKLHLFITSYHNILNFTNQENNAYFISHHDFKLMIPPLH